MGNINVLSFEIANLIAAGEVVDRPASVLKELLENAIDAGATHITAEIRAGGTSLIRVSDDGCGMEAEDLPISLRRNATSKIRMAEDLLSIGTLGFRGEALAATAAVSELQILSKPKDAAVGAMITTSYGRILNIAEVGVSDGTTVVVENLFGNVPARRKFLKKDATETMAATAVVEKIAISRPDISFEWITDGTTRFRTAGDGELKNTLYAILGRDFANRLLPVNGGTSSVAVHGFVGAPDNVRANRNHQNIFINNRYVKSKTVMAALEKAAVSYVAGERFPVCALFLELDPAFVDVNVHPAKLEVKFSDERAVFEAVYYAVRTAFEKNTTRPELTLPSKKTGKTVSSAFANEAFGPADQLRVDAKPSSKNTPLTTHAPAQTRKKEGNRDSTPAHQTVREAIERLRAQREIAERTPLFNYKTAMSSTTMLDGKDNPPTSLSAKDSKWIFRSDIAEAIEELRTNGKPAEPQTENAQKENAQKENTQKENAQKEAILHTPFRAAAPKEPEPTEPQVAAPDYRLIGEVFRCYLLVERGEELLLIDKHAAHERIIFEHLLAEQKKDGRVAAQELLIALPTPLSDAEFAAAQEYRTELEKVGFSYNLTDTPRRAELRSHPGAIDTEGARELFVRMCAELVDGTGTPDMTEGKRLERSLYIVACKAAIKGGRLYGDEQIAWLVGQVMALPDITVCPHGRPVAIRLSKTYLDREFNRIQ